jgi:hypothetical protein
MSAATRTIQQPRGSGSILRAIAFGVATLLVIAALAWVANATATKPVTSPASAPAGPVLIDRFAQDDAQSAPVLIDRFAQDDAQSAPKAAVPSLVPSDTDTHRSVPYVDRFAPIEPESVFDPAQRAPSVARDK